MIKFQVKIRNNKISGFTLLELLLAVFIFALIATGAYQVFNVAQRNASSINQKQKRIRDISLTLEIMEKDFTQLTPRFYRDPFSDAITPSLLTDYSGNFLVRLVRAGWRNPLGNNRSEQQAVAYRLVDDKLHRDYTQHLDNISSTEAVNTILLDNINSINLRYLDRSNGEWNENWPPSSSENQTQVSLADGQSEQISNYLPIAVELTINLDDLGELISIISLSPGA